MAQSDDAAHKEISRIDAEGTAPAGGEQEHILLSELINLEKSRIEVQRQRNDIVRRGLEAYENSDQRQYDLECKRLETDESKDARQHDLECKRLEADERKDQRTHSLARNVILSVVLTFIIAVAFLLHMAFFGDNTQSATAFKILAEIFKVLGGGGLLFLLIMGFQRLLRR